MSKTFFIILSVIVAAIAILFSSNFLEHTIEPTPIPGAIESSSPLRHKIVNMRDKTRKDKPFGTTRSTNPNEREAQHPFTAKAGSAGIHADAAASDVHPRGPNGQQKSLKMISRVGSKFPGGMCATTTFSKEGLLISLCASLRRFELHLLEPKTLRLLAMFPLPNRPSTWEMLMTLDPAKIMLDTSGGAYYYLDHQDRVVLADAKQRIRRIGHRRRRSSSSSSSSSDSELPYEFFDENTWDVSFMIPQDCMTWNNWFPSNDPEACDPITAVIPDFQGNIWFVTRRGIVGVLDPKKGKVIASIHLHEEMQNGLTAGEDGVWIVTDKALYCVAVEKKCNKRTVQQKSATKKSVVPVVVSSKERRKDSPLPFTPRAETDGMDGTFEITTVWSATYDRGSYRKVGMLSVGSGTTPTLFDGRFVTVTDNRDDPTIQLLVYDLMKIKQALHYQREHEHVSNSKNKNGIADVVVRAFETSDAPLVCQHGLFKNNQSASDNSMIAVDGSIFVENNCGHHNAIQQQQWSKKHIPGGIVRVDLIYDDLHKNKNEVVKGCKTVWESTERAPSCVAKLGQSQGLLYYYTLEDENDFDEEVKDLPERDDDEVGVGGIMTTLEWIFDTKNLFSFLFENNSLKSTKNNKNDKMIMTRPPPRPFWAVTAIDAHTGKTVFKVPTGRGRSFDNNWGPVTLGEDGTLYVGVIRGILAIYDDDD